MPNTDESNEAYEKGYEDGRNGSFLEDIGQGNKDAIPLPDSSTQSSYDAGYESGASDRYHEGRSK